MDMGRRKNFAYCVGSGERRGTGVGEAIALRSSVPRCDTQKEPIGGHRRGKRTSSTDATQRNSRTDARPESGERARP